MSRKVAISGRDPMWRAMPKLLVAAAAVLVCLPAGNAQDYGATVIVQTGIVSVKDSGGGLQIPVFVGNSIKPKQLIITGPDGYAKLQLSDGSTFEVFQNAKVIFREDLGDWKHMLNVWIGRVRVLIQHAPGVPNYNNVTSPTAVVSVRGTIFDVVVEDEEGTTSVLVEEGVVSVRNRTYPGDAAELKAGEGIKVQRGQPLVAKNFDKGGFFQKVARVIANSTYDVLLNRQPGVGIPSGGGSPTGGGSTGGNQGDKDKNPTGGTTTTPPGPTNTPPGPGGN